MIRLINPLWPVPDNVIAGVTTISGGVSKPPYTELNLAEHVDDSAQAVERNRALLDEYIRVEHEINHSLRWHWLNQTHSTKVLNLDNSNLNKLAPASRDADAACSRQKLQVCTILTADCLPILLADRKGCAVAAIHAGWRGLSQGVVANTIQELCATASATQSEIRPAQLVAWLGPAIGPQNFEVGPEVKKAFLSERFSASANRPIIEQAFKPLEDNKSLANLYQLATLALNASGVSQVYGGGLCTYQQQKDFYSYRRSSKTGRMASFVFIR